ncbi:MAG: hypothetical protein PHC41_08270 [Lachnospiraceae bacterium]|nr:hypothetical protein [Lachnospiraceae bacterium]MDD3616204.1 hypothetical protein [Lachnospiraceae bacterium]
MEHLSEKELSLINDSLAEEELLVKKYQLLSQQTQDTEMSSKFQQISQKHQGHYNALYSLL